MNEPIPISDAPAIIETTARPKSLDDDTVTPMPVWLSIVVIVLSLSAGGWIVHWYVGSDMLNRETSIVSNTVPSKPLRPQFNGPAVQQRGRGGWMIRSANARMVIAQRGKKPPRVQFLGYNNYGFVPAEQRTAIFTARRILRDGAVAKHLGMKPDQMKKLRSLEGTISMAATREDDERLLKLWADYQSAKNKTKPLAALEAAMTQIARKDLPATKALAAKHAADIHAALTPAQWHLFETMGR